MTSGNLAHYFTNGLPEFITHSLETTRDFGLDLKEKAGNISEDVIYKIKKAADNTMDTVRSIWTSIIEHIQKAGEAISDISKRVVLDKIVMINTFVRSSLIRR